MKQPLLFAQGIGIGMALMFALGAVSVLVRPGLVALATAGRRMARRPLNPLQQRTLPADHLDRCRAAGL
jgi:hypothetical protein